MKLFPMQLGKTAFKTRRCSDVCPTPFASEAKEHFYIESFYLISTLNKGDREKMHRSRQCFTDVQYSVSSFFGCCFRLQVKYKGE